jgi:dipeptidyl aminopeptidase/acylaminoacyl peptidase
VSFNSGDALIRGWYVRSRNRAGIVLVHGSSNDRRSRLPEARILIRHGYGVLLFDLPGCGESGGSFTLGRSERAALASALDWITSREDVDPQRVGVLGFSVGAYVAAIVAADDPRARALVLEGTLFDVEEQTRYEYGRYGLLSQIPAMLANRAHGYHPEDPGPRQALPRIAPRPLLFITGTDDTSVLPAQTEQAFAVAHRPKDLWAVPGAHHGDYARAAPVAYEERLTRFFDESLGSL